MDMMSVNYHLGKVSLKALRQFCVDSIYSRHRWPRRRRPQCWRRHSRWRRLLCRQRRLVQSFKLEQTVLACSMSCRLKSADLAY